MNAAATTSPLGAARSEASAQAPVYVDMDGTLIRTDLLWECLCSALRRNPLRMIYLPLWLIRGKAVLKRQLAKEADLDLASLPYRDSVIGYVRECRNSGRRTILATAAEQTLAEGVADATGLFDSVLATTREGNLKGLSKLAAIERDCHGAPYEYIGDSHADMPIWKRASDAVVVGDRASVLARLRSIRPDCRAISSPESHGGTWSGLGRLLRPHQWAKNLLLFIPLFASHQAADARKLTAAFAGFAAFCAIASFGYAVNDVLDIQADRRHRTKRRRPLASGEVSIPAALSLALLLLLVGSVLGTVLGARFAMFITAYLIGTLLYSVILKRKLLVDVLALAGLYTLRILAGGAATSTFISHWLLAFSMFMFLNLAFVKRYTEVSAMGPADGVHKVGGRGYYASDLDLIRSVGPASAYMSVLILCLYISSPDVTKLYTSPSALWLTCPVLLYWTSRVWFLAQRQQMTEDPVLFAIGDRISWGCGVVLALIAAAASMLHTS